MAILFLIYTSMNYIGLDTSLTSTAICLKNENGYFFFSYFKDYSKPTKWTRPIEDFTKITGITYKKDDDYSIQEMYKLHDYQQTVGKIIQDLKSKVTDSPVRVAIEGYSFASDAGKIIDLVTLGTLIRNAITVNFKCPLTIYSPSTLKKEASGLIYGWDKKRKMTRNPIGIAGGSFKKHQMLEAINNSDFKSPMTKFIKENFMEMYRMKRIPHPIEDLVDAHLAVEVLIDSMEGNGAFKINPELK
jgi:hypothetical protein